MPKRAKYRLWRCTAPYRFAVRLCKVYPWYLQQLGLSITGTSSRGILRREITRLSRNTVLVRTAMPLRRLGEIAVWRRRGRLPLQRGRPPRVVGMSFFSAADAPEEIDDERNLRQRQAHRRPQ